ncbi:ankyrin repeat-containing domain protein, partial [Pelagophyceae sp. CCMP2097]
VDALRRGDVGRIKQLLDGGIDVNSPMAEPKKGAARPTAPLLYAAKQGHVEIVRLLLDRGARIGDALVSTARDGDIPMLQLLLDRGALVNEASPTQRMFTTETALSVAADRGDVAVLRLLLDRGAAVNLPVEHRDSDWTPVFLAARRGHVSAIEVLVARGASVHHTTKSMGAIQGTTPLAVAIASGHRNVARCLLRRGAD